MVTKCDRAGIDERVTTRARAGGEHGIILVDVPCRAVKGRVWCPLESSVSTGIDRCHWIEESLIAVSSLAGLTASDY